MKSTYRETIPADGDSRVSLKQKRRIVDVATASGFSVTTVERVLNERGSVSEVTRNKILASAKEIGIQRVLPSPIYRNMVIEAILPSNYTEYWKKLSAALKDAARLLPRGVSLHRTFVPENDAGAMIDAISRPALKRMGLIVAAETAPQIQAELAAAILRGEFLVTISSMVRGLDGNAFSGIDNLAAGRTAASLINFGLRGTRARVVVLQATIDVQSHRDRVDGFLDMIDPECIVETLVTHERPGASRRLLEEALNTGELPAAIYETGDPGDEIAPTLRMLARKPIWIGHERNDIHEDLLREGILDFVIDQDPSAQVRWAINHILTRAGIDVSNFAGSPKPELRLLSATSL